MGLKSSKRVTFRQKKRMRCLTSRPMTRLIVVRVAKGELRLLQPVQVPAYAMSEFILFIERSLPCPALRKVSTLVSTFGVYAKDGALNR
jgi:hypothetical protein